MSETVTIAKTVAVDCDKVWSAISSIGGLDRWFPIISTCRVEGDGVGATRIMTLVDGAEMRDRVLEIDHTAKRFRYERPQLPFPVRNYVGTVKVRDVGGSKSEVSWIVSFDGEQEAREQVSALVFRAISDGISGLERDLQ